MGKMKILRIYCQCPTMHCNRGLHNDHFSKRVVTLKNALISKNVTVISNLGIVLSLPKLLIRKGKTLLVENDRPISSSYLMTKM